MSKGLDNLFKSAENYRIIIATFASNVNRVQQIIDCAEKYGRKVAFSGRSMVNYMDVAQKLGYLHLPENILIDIDMLDKYMPQLSSPDSTDRICPISFHLCPGGAGTGRLCCMYTDISYQFARNCFFRQDMPRRNHLQSSRYHRILQNMEPQKLGNFPIIISSNFSVF